MERDPNKAGLMLVKNRIARIRITVWDVLHYLETGWACLEIAGDLAPERSPSRSCHAVFRTATARAYCLTPKGRMRMLATFVSKP